MVKVSIFALDLPFKREFKENLISFLNSKEKKSLPSNGSVRFDSSLAGKVAIKKLLSNYYEINLKDIVIEKTILGKPYIQELHKFGVSISISHSGKYLAVAFNTQGEIGIDIEIRKTVEINNLLPVFSINEITYIRTCKSKLEKNDRFYSLWTLKEAYLKAIGKGFYEDSPECVQVLSNGQYAVRENIKKNYTEWFFNQTYSDTYFISICSNKKVSSSLSDSLLTPLDLNKYVIENLN